MEVWAWHLTRGGDIAAWRCWRRGKLLPRMARGIEPPQVQRACERIAVAIASAWIKAQCLEPSSAHILSAEQRQRSLTKPAGSLGILESIAISLAALQRRERPRAERAPILLFAGDHGVTAQGISAYPSAVTVEMLRNFARGGAAISVLARELGVHLSVIDAGTLAPTPVAGVITDKPRLGTRDFSREAALTGAEVDFALACGRRAVGRVITDGADLLLLGDMGIGNTTSAAAVAASILGRPAHEIAGAGTGLDGERVAHKAQIIAAALELHGLARRATDAYDALAAVGGLEIVALTGAMIAAAQHSLPVFVDGFIVSVAALGAVRLNPSIRPWLLFAHRSAERGHAIVLEALAAQPILDLGLRLGEGSGAAIALPLVRLACALHAGMATFEEAAVSGAAQGK
jgi:nicotinate-nucleotide--dimethylbenzimidazole phosphoribosyltransferase